jgi:hypothetical protein
MPRRKAPEDMSVEELRRLLIEKRRGARRERLEHFKRTGRVVDVTPDVLETSAPVVDTLFGPRLEAPTGNGSYAARCGGSGGDGSRRDPD